MHNVQYCQLITSYTIDAKFNWKNIFFPNLNIYINIFNIINYVIHISFLFKLFQHLTVLGTIYLLHI